MTVSYNKDRSRWMYNFVRAGKRYQGYCLDAAGAPCTSRSAAREAEGIEKRRVSVAPKVTPASEMTLTMAAAVLLPSWQRQTDWPNKQRYLNEVLNFFGRETAIASIDASDVQRYISHALAQQKKIWRSGPRSRMKLAVAPTVTIAKGAAVRSPATVKLYLNVLRQLLAQGVLARAIDAAPDVPKLKTMKRKARPMPDAALARAFSLLPDHVREAVELTLYFGFRRSEAFSLEIHQIDFESGGVRLYAERVKDKEDAFLPGAPAAMALLSRLAMQAKERGQTRLITYRQGHLGQWRGIKSPRRAWKTAMKTVQAEFGARWRWHDIRAAFITQIALTSGPAAAQALARHSDYDTTRAYVEVADEVRRRAANAAAERPSLQAIAGGKKSLTESTNKKDRLGDTSVSH